MGFHMDERKVKTFPPTSGERYAHLKENAEAFVQNMATMIAALERDGNADLATKLKVWCLMPWQSALKADSAGDLWPVCEACLLPIKVDSDRISSDACDFHKKCVG